MRGACTNSGSLNRRFAAALAFGSLTLALPGTAFANPGPDGGGESHHHGSGSSGGCGGCGSGGGNDAAIQDASQRARDAAAAAGNGSGVSVTVSSGGRPSEALGGAIAQLGATQAENARPSDAELAEGGYFGPVPAQEMESIRKRIEQADAAVAKRMKDPAYRKEVEEEEARWRQEDAEEARERRMDQEVAAEAQPSDAGPTYGYFDHPDVLKAQAEAEARRKESEPGEYGYFGKPPDRPTDTELAEHGYFGNQNPRPPDPSDASPRLSDTPQPNPPPTAGPPPALPRQPDNDLDVIPLTDYAGSDG